MKYQKVTSRQWIKTIQDPALHVHFHLQGVSCELPFPGTWDTGHRCLAEHLVYVVTSGRINALIGGESLVLSPGDICWVMPGENFRFHADEGCSGSLLRWRMRIEMAGRSLRLVSNYVLKREGQFLMPWMRTMAAEAQNACGRRRPRARMLLGLFCWDLWCAGPAESKQAEGARWLPGLMQRGWRWTPQGMALEAGLSLDYFSRQFRRQTGLSPRTWLLSQRMKHASFLLEETPLPVGEVARQVGAEDVFLFSRQFKQRYGLSPRAWRHR